MRRASRRKLIERIDDIYALTWHAPIKSARVIQRNEQGYSIGHVAAGRDRLIQILADLSLTHRIVEVYWQAGWCVSSSATRTTIVRFYLNPDKNYTTNIDAEMLEHVAKMRWGLTMTILSDKHVERHSSEELTKTLEFVAWRHRVCQMTLEFSRTLNRQTYVTVDGMMSALFDLSIRGYDISRIDLYCGSGGRDCAIYLRMRETEDHSSNIDENVMEKISQIEFDKGGQ